MRGPSRLVPGAARPISGAVVVDERPGFWHHHAMRFMMLLRQVMRISRTEMSRESGVSVRELARIEDEGHVPTSPVIGRIDRAFARIRDQRLGLPTRPEAAEREAG